MGVKETVANAVAPKHSKESILQSKRWAGCRDLLGVLLDDGAAYTAAEVEQKINDYKERGIR